MLPNSNPNTLTAMPSCCSCLPLSMHGEFACLRTCGAVHLLEGRGVQGQAGRRCQQEQAGGWEGMQGEGRINGGGKDREREEK